MGNRTIQGERGEAYYIHEYDKNEKVIRGLIIIKLDKGKIQKQTLIEKAYWKEDFWEGENIVEEIYSPDAKLKSTQKIERTQYTNLFNPSELYISREESDYLSIREIKSLIRTLPKSKTELRTSLKVDYHRRYAFALVPLILLFTGIPFAIAPIRSATAKTLGFGIVICLVYYIVDTFFCQAGRGMMLSPSQAAWAANGVFSVLCLGTLRRVEH